MTGSIPGIAASTSETWLLGSPPNSVEAPENNFEWEVTWAWTSRPMTISQSPVAPLMSLDGLTGAFIARLLPRQWVIHQQRGNDLFPLGFERTGRNRFARLPIPVTGIAEIALDTVQIGVDPGCVCAAFGLHDLMRLVPVSFAGPPQRRERRGNAGVR